MMTLLPTENWQFNIRDGIRALASLIGRRKFPETIHLTGLGECIPTRSARVGLIAALKSLRLSAGSKIGVPLYCCPVVFKAIEAANCTARFIDVDFETYCMSVQDLFRKGSKIDAVIAVHMFGNLCDIPALKKAVPGKPIIEDCAQALGSRLNGQVAGTLGNIAAFSFRSGKYLSVGEGGALFSIQEKFQSALKKSVAGMPVPRLADECVHIALTWLRSTLRRKPFYGMVGYPLWAIYNKKVNFTEKSPIIVSQIYKSDLVTITHRLGGLDSEIGKQRKIADFYARTLSVESDMLCLEMPGTFYNRYLYPILFHSTEQRDSMAVYLKERNIDTSKPYKDVIEGAAKHYGYEGDCPVAEEIANRILVIPCHHRMKKTEIERTAEYVNDGWEKIQNMANRKLLTESVSKKHNNHIEV